MGLEGRTAPVSGSSRGIGRAIALRLAEEEAKVIVNCRSREKEAGAILGPVDILVNNATIHGGISL